MTNVFCFLIITLSNKSTAYKIGVNAEIINKFDKKEGSTEWVKEKLKNLVLMHFILQHSQASRRGVIFTA